ncbi:MAG: NADPH-dependent glutamate synthase [Clostridia bacterium]|nr:MAG: Glutamate synthase (NADPH) small chain [Firmicutes bacterium ADurb.Bin146]HPB16022.1 NADPH-dependent glutamate synthase [Clostridia bacterium]HQM95434.1 NADPH-dependent glutamate synthase [Clostridia bacterium]HQO68775.1 NADPH-dependent glutamate synthase [Clostridia bacterium]
MAKVNMTPVKTKMPEQDPNIRNGNFLEVTTGYTPQMAYDEAMRCLNCKHKPCVAGCPVNIDIPNFIQSVTQGNIEEAYEIITRTNSLPAICGRVCPQESQCELPCVRGIKGEPVAIGRLERYVADYMLAKDNFTTDVTKPATKKNKKIAIVGSGPSGLAAASDLCDMGYDVTIFEALHKAGGVLVYGIPEFRLPKSIVEKEIERLKTKGVNIELNMVIGKTISIEELHDNEGFEAVFVGTGAGLPNFMNIPGENLNGVYSANEFLTRVNLMKAYDPSYDTPIYFGSHVAVVGGGNVAMDAARAAKRLGAEHVSIVYRRSEQEMPARVEEVHHAKEEGINFHLLTNPTQILGEKGWVKGMECVKMQLSDPGTDGRRRPVVIPGSEYILDTTSVIIAIGTSPNPLIKSTTYGLDTNKWGCIIADTETGQTSIPYIFAGGDVVTGAATVILAMGAGKKAAAAIDKYLDK